LLTYVLPITEKVGQADSEAFEPLRRDCQKGLESVKRIRR
jgi:hypothetical protein